MGIGSTRKPFSKRHGYSSQSKQITVWEGAPENLRHFVLETAGEMGYGPSAIRNLICSVLHVRPDPSNWSEYPNIWGEAQDLVYGCDWFKFYDFVEEMYRSLANSTADNVPERCSQFQDALNEFFIDEGIGWQMVDGEVVTRALRHLSPTFTVQSTPSKGSAEPLQVAKYMRL
jgi:AbiJ N-terminal domain 4